MYTYYDKTLTNSTYFSTPPTHILKVNSTEWRQTPFGASSTCFSCDEMIQQYSTHSVQFLTFERNLLPSASTQSSLWGKGTENCTPSDRAPHSRRNALPTKYDKDSWHTSGDLVTADGLYKTLFFPLSLWYLSMGKILTQRNDGCFIDMQKFPGIKCHQATSSPSREVLMLSL
jgi:hypothetical protein